LFDKVISAFGNDWERSIMKWKRYFGINQFDSLAGLICIHGKDTTNIKKGYIYGVKSSVKLHITEKTSVPGMVDRGSVIGLDDSPDWIGCFR
jgi:hypothetical protein